MPEFQQSRRQPLYVPASVEPTHTKPGKPPWSGSFSRDKHSVTLTDIGKIFAHDVERIVEDYELSMKHIQMSKTGAVGAIELTTSYTLSSLFVYDFLPAFNRDYPDIKVNFIIEESGPFIKKRIEENKTDLVLMLDWTERIFPIWNISLLSGIIFMYLPTMTILSPIKKK